MEMLIRKPTRLKDFNYSSEGAYFITICTHNKRKLLCDIVGVGAYDNPKIELSGIGKIVEKYILSTNSIAGLTVDKYVIMPNHIHMILILQNHNGMSRVPSPTNSVIPHAVSTFKRFVNAEVGQNVFQRFYHDHIIRDKSDYSKIWNYIDTNPQKWNEDYYYIPTD